jgi:soluble lytic murein transglycosylase
MIPEAAFRTSARLFLFLTLLGASSALGYGQEGGAFGLSSGRLAEIFAGKDLTPVLALGEGDLGDTGAFGPSAYYYLARWIDSRIAAMVPVTLPARPSSPDMAASTPSPEAATRARLLYRMAYDRGSGMLRREAGLALLGSLYAGGLWDELLDFSSEYAKGIGPEWKSERPRLDALDALGQSKEEAALASRMSTAFPAEAAKDAEALAYFAASANLRSSADDSAGAAWRSAFRRILLIHPSSVWSGRAYALVQSEPKLRALFSQEELHALAMRDAVRRKDYGGAYREAVLAPRAALSRAASQPMIADAGKAFLYSGMASEGAPRFAALESAASKSPSPTGASAGIGWTALYYRARFARTLERWDEASSLFKRASAGAPTKADADSCLWYAADSAYQGASATAALIGAPSTRAAAESAARASLLDAIVAASVSRKESGTFSDLVNGLFRDAMRARDWSLVESMALRLAGKISPDTAARVAYTAARAFELGLGADPGIDPKARAAEAALRFRAIANDGSATLYYRALAAWRAGIEPVLASPDASASDFATTAEAPGETEAFLGGMAGFGLDDMALSEAKSREDALSDLDLRRLAVRFSSLGRPDCAIRLALELYSRPNYEPQRSDYELLYPRPYLGEIRSLRLEPRVPERLAFGLVRSESVFKADALSWAGAVGLSQLMPATAADQAKALGLASYDLKKPKDNLAIGLAHFASLLDRTEGKPLRAMMAYNAGWGRLRAWVAASGDLPDDLLVEALGIEETRQYCRNILQATVMYGTLYYGRSVGETVGELVEGETGNAAQP